MSSPKRKRDVPVLFWVSPAEMDVIQQKMAQFGTKNLSAYLRKMAVDGYMVQLDLPELKELVSLLRRSSNNLNQLTRKVHETGRIYDADLEDISQRQEQLWDGVMATTRIMPLHIGKGRTESQAISDIIDYVANPQKTDNGKLITGYGCDSRTADAEFLLAKRQYIAATGRVRGMDDVIAYHVRQSFKPGEITPEEANRLGVEFAKRFTKGNHAFVVCTHIDKSHVHNHIIWSAVNTDCDRKFRNFWGSTRAVRRLSDTICIENGLSIVENPKPHGKSYNKWLDDQAKPSHREQLRVMIDRALEQKPADFDALLKLLSEMGCEVSRRGKAIRLKAPGWKNVARMDDKLGAGYSEAEIRAVLAGEKQHTPRKKSTVQPEPPKVNLLVDIQAKLQAGKGAGYARWAKVFNLKQMAQTVNFLTEHQLLDYAELAEKAAAATAHHNELSAQIKAAEKRIAEIAVLRTHIINYAKTRETYVAYTLDFIGAAAFLYMN